MCIYLYIIHYKFCFPLNIFYYCYPPHFPICFLMKTHHFCLHQANNSNTNIKRLKNGDKTMFEFIIMFPQTMGPSVVDVVTPMRSFRNMLLQLYTRSDKSQTILCQVCNNEHTG